MSTVDLQPIALDSPHVKTSLVEVTNKLPIKPPCRVFFKNELEQPSGSFKLRGIGYLVKSSIEKARREQPNKEIQVFASSGGNAGLAAGYLAFYYNLKCTVVLPVIAKQVVQDKLKSYGANIILFGNNINEADQHLRNLMNSMDLNEVVPIYCHPFNNPLIWKGHETLVDEVVDQLGPSHTKHLKGMVCSFGGGGLYNGIYQGMRNNHIENGEILAIETAQAPTLTDTLKAGELITLESVKSLATSLACSHTTKNTLEYFNDGSHIISRLELIDDVDSLRGCLAFKKCTNKTVEPACGAAVSVVYDKIDAFYKHFGHLRPDDIVVIVVCGGTCTTDQDLSGFQQIINRSEIKL